LWDASALVKRYTPETGKATVDALFTALPAANMVTTFWGYAETHASLLRKRNKREISARFFGTALTLLRGEIRQDPDWTLLTIDDLAVLAGIELLLRHNLNTTDGVILATYLRYQLPLPTGSPTVVLVAADTRLLRAATAEGLSTLNPEVVAAADVPALLATL
jgi:predicted nucleic acid-binding protein